MRLLTPAFLFVVAVAVTGASAAASAGTDDDAYRLPLVGPYAIYRPIAPLTPREGTRPSQLIKSSAPDGPNGWSMTTLLGDVENVAVERNLIFGRSKDGFFVLDGGVAEGKPTMFDSPEAWRATLAGAGISDPASLLRTPDALAASVPVQALRPWNYRAMRNRLGLSDDAWSLLVQGLGALLALLLGLFWTTERRRPIGEAVVLGLVVNVVAQIVIAGGGPGAFVGFVGLPLMYMLATALGTGLRGVVRAVLS
jgi:hypothetical protein